MLKLSHIKNKGKVVMMLKKKLDKISVNTNWSVTGFELKLVCL